MGYQMTQTAYDRMRDGGPRPLSDKEMLEYLNKRLGSCHQITSIEATNGRRSTIYPRVLG